MSTEPQASSWARRPLWMIAFALLVIAVCLVLNLLRQPPVQPPESVVVQSGSERAAESSSEHGSSLAPRTLNRRPPPRTALPAPLQAPEPEVANTAPEPAGDSGGFSTGLAPLPRGGYAPLTGLGTPGSSGNNGRPDAVTGKVTLRGTPPPEKVIPMDAICGKLHTNQVTTRHFIVGPDGGLANVFVFIKSGLEGRRYPPPREARFLDQVGCLYEPFVSGVMVNQKLAIRNSDPLLHNVHATSKLNGEFNFAQVRRGQVDERSFSHAEVLVRFKCDVHPWMFAYVGVVEHPFFAVTDNDGNFSIPNVPPGNYVLEAYHLKAHGDRHGLTQEISVRAGEPTMADFIIELPNQ